MLLTLKQTLISYHDYYMFVAHSASLHSLLAPERCLAPQRDGIALPTHTQGARRFLTRCIRPRPRPNRRRPRHVVVLVPAPHPAPWG